MHPLLARQFKNALGVDAADTSGLPAAWLDFAAMVEQASLDSDQALAKPSIDTASRELVKRNRELPPRNPIMEAVGPEPRASHEDLEQRVDPRAAQLSHTDDAAERAHQHVSLLLDSTGVGIFGVDLTDRCTFGNRAAGHMLGYTVAEMLGQNMHDLIHYKHADGSSHSVQDCPIFQSFKLNQHHRVSEDVFWRRDGVAILVEYSAFPIRDGQRVIGSVVAFSDISARKRVEAELRRAKETAENASHAKSEFLARMSHEIRTPLNGVIGMVDLLLATELAPTQQRYVQLARESANALMTVIDDILDFSKIEAGKMEFESATFDPHKLIRDQIAVLGPLAAKRNLTLECSLTPDVPHALIGDPNRIRQVVINLVGNALKFTTRGFITVRASMEDQGAAGPALRIDVRDTGIGIAPHLLDRLFKSFSQVDSSTTRRFGGTGLGLAISKRLIELMGGQIGVESQEGRGTTFWFTLNLPAVASVPALQRAPSPISAAIAQTHEPLEGLHLLVAEDNEMNQFVTREMLKRTGCTCDVVADGQAAIDASQCQRYDAILMDCRMPGLDGLDATRRIREIERAAGATHVPIIALTAEAVCGDRDKCVEAGMDAYVSKPIDARQLVTAIHAVVLRTRTQLPSARSEPVAPAVQQTGTAPADVPIDVRALLSRCLGDAAFARTTLELFQQRALADVDRLKKSLVECDAVTVNNLAHNLKAVAAHVGAAKLRAITFEIEQAGARQDLQFAQQHLADLAAEADRCAAYIPQAIDRLGHMGSSGVSPKASR